MAKMSRSIIIANMKVKLYSEKKDFGKNKELFFLTLPGIIFVLIFSYFPMFGAIVAFKDYKVNKGFFGSKWVGFKNFEYLFSQEAFSITRNTIAFNLTFIAITLFFAVVFALMLNELANRRLLKTYQTVLFFPYFLSWVVVSYLVFALLDMDSGWLNSLLSNIGVKPIAWYTEPKYWIIILPITSLWKNVGYYTLIYYTCIMGIDSEYYEASMIDGASKLKQITKITLPLLMPIIIIMLILQIGKMFFADFGLFFQVTRDSPSLYPVTDVIDTYVYRALRTLGDYGMSSAAGLYQSFVGFVLVIITNTIVKKIDNEKALF